MYSICDEREEVGGIRNQVSYCQQEHDPEQRETEIIVNVVEWTMAKPQDYCLT